MCENPQRAPKENAAIYSRRRISAFTIVELLVASAVLCLILALLLQVINGTLQSSRLINQRLDATEGARRALDILATDLGNCVIDSDTFILASANQDMAFITRGRGPRGVSTRFLAVNFRVNADHELIRSFKPIAWGTSDLLAQSVESATGTKSVLSRGILALSIQAILEDGRSVPIFPIDSSAAVVKEKLNSVIIPSNWGALRSNASSTEIGSDLYARSLLITVVAVDERNYKLLESSGSLMRIINVLTQPLADENISLKWSSSLDNSSFELPAKAAIRILSKTVELP